MQSIRETHPHLTFGIWLFFTSDFQNLAFLRQTSFDGQTAKFQHFEKKVSKLFLEHKNTSKKRPASQIGR